jgi:hypothetical protein
MEVPALPLERRVLALDGDLLSADIHQAVNHGFEDLLGLQSSVDSTTDGADVISRSTLVQAVHDLAAGGLPVGASLEDRITGVPGGIVACLIPRTVEVPSVRQAVDEVPPLKLRFDGSLTDTVRGTGAVRTGINAQVDLGAGPVPVEALEHLGLALRRGSVLTCIVALRAIPVSGCIQTVHQVVVGCLSIRRRCGDTDLPTDLLSGGTASHTIEDAGAGIRHTTRGGNAQTVGTHRAGLTSAAGTPASVGTAFLAVAGHEDTRSFSRTLLSAAAGAILGA